jgi:hypothetical protein
MSFARNEQDRCRAAYDFAVTRWFAARDAGDIVREDDERERSAGVRWRAASPNGKSALGAFQLAKSNLDHAAARVRREAGDVSCPECSKLPEGPRVDFGDSRLPPEHDEEARP